MSTDTTTTNAKAPGDPIDVLLPPPRPWWARLAFAAVIIVGTGMAGYQLHVGALRPSPNCCGSGGSSAQMGQSLQPEAATVTAYFYNSSPRSIVITNATAELEGATVVDVSPYTDAGSYEMPPRSLADLPFVVEANSDTRLAITFTPDRCDDQSDGQDWGLVQLDLAVAGNPWYPTFSRAVSIPVLDAGSDQLSVMPPAEYDDEFASPRGPLESACILVGR